MRTTRLGLVSLVLGLAAPLVTPVPAATRIEKDLALAPGGRLILDADAGEISVTGGSPSGVHLVITSDRDDLEQRFAFTFEERSGEVEIAAERKGKDGLLGFLSGWSFGGQIKFEVRVPTATSLRLDTAGGSIRVAAVEGAAELDTSGGSIEVHDLAGDLLADTSGGSIRIARVGGDVTADTSGGSIHVEEVDGRVSADTSGGSIRMCAISGDVVADTSGGSIHVQDAGGRVEADTSGGSVEVSFTPGNARGGALSASGGGVTVTLDPGVGLEIDAEASGGRVACDLAVAGRGQRSDSSLRGPLGSGGEPLRLRSSGGSIRIRSL